jgi:hypothetical protein
MFYPQIPSFFKILFFFLVIFNAKFPLIIIWVPRDATKIQNNSKTVVPWLPSGPQICGRCWKAFVVQRLFYFMKTQIGTPKWWSQKASCRYSEVIVSSGLTVIILKVRFRQITIFFRGSTFKKHVGNPWREELNYSLTKQWPLVDITVITPSVITFNLSSVICYNTK